jgi:hypothetical protein
MGTCAFNPRGIIPCVKNIERDDRDSTHGRFPVNADEALTRSTS